MRSNPLNCIVSQNNAICIVHCQLRPPMILFSWGVIMKSTGLVYACIAPHGSELIPALAGSHFDQVALTRSALEELGRNMAASAPDTIVVVTPHGLRLDTAISIVTTDYTSGALEENGGRVEAEFVCDRLLAEQILQEARSHNLPVVGALFGALEGPASRFQLDWGALIPLWFMGAHWDRKPKVLIGPCRTIPLTDLVTLGRIIARKAEQCGHKVALIASADQAHAHHAEGPYGFDPAAALYDAAMQEIVRDGHLEHLLKLDPGLVASAKPDSLWQMLVLYGATLEVSMQGRLLSYQVPTYFGMLCASYEVRKY